MAVLTALVMILAGTVQAANNGGVSLVPRPPTIKPEKSVVLDAFDRRRIEVKFVDDADIGISAAGWPIDRSGQLLGRAESDQLFRNIFEGGGSWRRMTAVTEERIDEMRQTAQNNLGRAIADINNYFILDVPSDIQTEDWLDQLNSLDEVEIALAMPLPMPAPGVPGNFQGSQGYLLPAPGGIGASAAWLVPGGTGWPTAGGPVRVSDLEYSWNINHSDLQFVWYDPPPGFTPVDPFSDDNHGTAVLGEMSSLNNGWGVTGTVYAANSAVTPTNYTTGWDIGLALSWRASGSSPGDVIIIEQQMAGPNYPGVGAQDGLVPIEWWASWYNVVVTTVGMGIHVVEAAGNGRENLDAAVYGTGNGGHWPFLSVNNSGAIIVGAGAAPAAFSGSDVDRSRLWYSNYGSRLDLQGWGERVMTTGYGSYYSAEGKNLWYTNTFGGTSSATPIVASAVAILSSIHRDANNSNISPNDVINILKSTGSPQQAGTYPTSQNIGPRPDLTAAIAALPSPSCCSLRGDFNGDGSRDIIDILATVSYLFQGGIGPVCAEEGDVDASGGAIPITIADILYMAGWLYQGGFAPISC